jgi:UDP-glucose 4-epimerase
VHVLVTGADGFIGAHLISGVAKRGHSVSTTVLAAHDLRQVGPPIEPTPDVIFHLAAQTSVQASLEDPVTDAQTNIIGTLRVLAAAEATGAHVVFASSAAATEPIDSPYGLSKRTAERYCYLASPSVTVLRFANVYGPGGYGVVSIFARLAARDAPATIYGDGRQTRDFIHVDDVIGALIHAGETRPEGVFHIGTGVQTDLLTLADLLDLDVIHAEPLPGDRRHSCLEPTLPGWAPTIVIDMLRRDRQRLTPA